MIKLIVSDLDGTLLKQFKTLSDRNRLAVIKAQEIGVKFAIATGRGFDSTQQFIKQLHLKENGGYMIINNGQRFIDVAKNHEEASAFISIEDARAAFRFAQKNHLQMVMDGENGLVFYSPEKLKIYRDIYLALIKILPYFSFILRRIHVFALFGFLKSQDVQILKNEEDIDHVYDKIGFTHFKHELDRSMNEITEVFKDRLEIMRVSDNWLDISPLGITKLVGIKKVMELEGIMDDEVMVMGDSENDATMLSYFKYSIAMKNASDKIKKLANYTTATNKEDGVAQAIEKFVFDEHNR